MYIKKKSIKQLSYSLVPFDMSIHLVGSQSDYSQSMLRAEKRTAQLSAPANPTCVLRKLCRLQWWRERRRANKVHEDVVRAIYAWAKINFFRHFTVNKTRFPLPYKRLSCVYSGLLVWMQYIKSVFYTAGK